MNNQLDLSEFFSTKSQANDFIERLSIIIDEIYEIDFNLEKTFAEQFGIEKKDIFISILRENNFNNLTNNQVKEMLVNIQELIKKLPVINLTLAFNPNEDNLKAISQWFLYTFNKQYLIDIKVDNSLIAGVIINFNGKFKDYSIKNTFSDMVKNIVIKNGQKQTNVNTLHQNTQFISIGR